MSVYGLRGFEGCLYIIYDIPTSMETSGYV